MTSPAQESDRILTAAMNRPDESKGTFVTGGDVSRFQRSTTGSPRPVGGAAAAARPAGGASMPVIHVGPVVRVTRGKNTTTEEAGR